MRGSIHSSAVLLGWLLGAFLALPGCGCHEPTVHFYEGFEDCDGTCGWDAAAGDAELSTMLVAGEHGLLVRQAGARRHFAPGEIPKVRYLQLSVLSDCWQPGSITASLSFEIAHDSETLLSGRFIVAPTRRSSESCSAENDCYPIFERLSADVETTRAQIAWLRLHPTSAQDAAGCRIDQVAIYEWDETPEGMDRCEPD